MDRQQAPPSTTANDPSHERNIQGHQPIIDGVLLGTDSQGQVPAGQNFDYASFAADGKHCAAPNMLDNDADCAQVDRAVQYG